MRIIGLSGKMGVGKTTVARMLCELIPGAERAAFGDLIKREVAEKYGVPLVYFYKAKEMPVWATPERYGAGWPENRRCRSITVRELMQWYGTEFVRAENPDYWVIAMRETLRNRERAETLVVIIDDVRFPNEAFMIRERGGLLIRIEPYPGYSVPEEQGKHASETALDEWGYWDGVFRPEFGEEHLQMVAGVVVG